jgi:hypothetical protein
MLSPNRAFDGWDQVNYVAGEMKNIERDLPRVVHLSMFSVMVRRYRVEKGPFTHFTDRRCL